MREVRESLPYRQIVSDEDFINIIKHNAVKWEQVKKVHFQPVTLTVRGCEKEFDFTKDLEKAFKESFPDIKVTPHQTRSRYVCEVLLKVRYVFINKKASFLTAHFKVADSRYPDTHIHSAFSEGVIELEAIADSVKEAMTLHLKKFKKDITQGEFLPEVVTFSGLSLKPQL